MVTASGDLTAALCRRGGIGSVKKKGNESGCQRDVPEFELLSAGFVVGIIAPYGLSGALQSFPKKEIKDRHSL